MNCCEARFTWLRPNLLELSVVMRIEPIRYVNLRYFAAPPTPHELIVRTLRVQFDSNSLL